MQLLHELILTTAEATPDAVAFSHRGDATRYSQLASAISRFSGGLTGNGLSKGDRVAVYLAKEPEAVISFFATAMAGGVFVPINPQLKSAQVAHILADSDATFLVTTATRAQALISQLGAGITAQIVVIPDNTTPDLPNTLQWRSFMDNYGHLANIREHDLAALLYTSGSTGKPKGVMLSHENLVCGAKSVSSYLKNRPEDKLLALLPFSFDYGFSQLSTAFFVGAEVVLFDYLLPRDVIGALERDNITGLACVPPVWNQLAQLEWPDNVKTQLRYITNSGGSLPGNTLTALRSRLPNTQVYLMYGLTEAFRSTYLEPAELRQRPDSIGKAIPDAVVHVLRQDGSVCDPGEHGELVHSGPLVAQGYWKDQQQTEMRFRPLPKELGGKPAVYSGDTVYRDEEGFLYFAGRRDSMIKTMGYRVSPTEVEEVIHESGLVSEAVALGVPHPQLGQAIVVVASPSSADAEREALLPYCRQVLANYMVPAHIEWRKTLPHTPNDKLDRKQLSNEFLNFFSGNNS